MSTSYYYVDISERDLKRLQATLAVAFRFCGDLRVSRVDPNQVVKYASLSVTLDEYTAPDLLERVHATIRGFLEGAEVPTSTPAVVEMRLTLEHLLLLLRIDQAPFFEAVQVSPNHAVLQELLQLGLLEPALTPEAEANTWRLTVAAHQHLIRIREMRL